MVSIERILSLVRLVGDREIPSSLPVTAALCAVHLNIVATGFQIAAKVEGC